MDDEGVHSEDEWETLPNPNDPLPDWATRVEEGTDPQEWAVYGMKLLLKEVGCIVRHLERNEKSDAHSDAYDTLMHMSSLIEGLQHVSRVVTENLATEMELAMVNASLIERKWGVPMKVVKYTSEDGSEFLGLESENVVVPESVDEWLNGE